MEGRKLEAQGQLLGVLMSDVSPATGPKKLPV
jgi:hypothetical protein